MIKITAHKVETYRCYTVSTKWKRTSRLIIIWHLATSLFKHHTSWTILVIMMCLIKNGQHKSLHHKSKFKMGALIQTTLAIKTKLAITRTTAVYRMRLMNWYSSLIKIIMTCPKLLAKLINSATLLAQQSTLGVAVKINQIISSGTILRFLPAMNHSLHLRIL